MRRVIVVLAGLAVLVVMSLALGLAHPFGNRRAATIVPTDAPSTLLLEHALIPVEVKSVLRQKCADCHSTQTHWPWYGHLGGHAHALWSVRFFEFRSRIRQGFFGSEQSPSSHSAGRMSPAASPSSLSNIRTNG